MGESGPLTPPSPPPPRAFAQGVGTVFQTAGVLLFLGMAAVCCGTSLLSKDTAERTDWAGVGWGEWTDVTDPAHPVLRAIYPATLATTLSVTVGAVLGVALAGVGLGLQAERRSAPAGAVVVAGAGTAFWVVQAAFAVQKLPSVVLGVLACLLAGVFGVLCALAVGAWRATRRHPPPAGPVALPAGYKVPYSHYHQDPPDVRLARELAARREKLAVQQKELERLEEQLRRHAQRTDCPDETDGESAVDSRG